MSHVICEIDGPIGILTLNNPERHNAFDETLIADLTRELKALDARADLRVVVLSAAGKSFSAGADLNWMKRMAAYSHEDNLRDAAGLGELMRTLHGLSKPTIARVQGPAYGGGVGLVACCDIAVGTFDAAFSLSEVKLGLIPAVISPYVIAAIGERAAHRYFLTAERFDAAEAYRLGLLHELTPDEEKMDEVINTLCTALLAAGPQAQSEAKRLIAAVAQRPITAEVVADTAQRIARIRAGDEGKEGIGAFLAKRKANWNIERS
ncbi:MAG: enoyl-CoA hydratase/isomerase family protein [Betaproteobacteria bacterium]|nr:enoyl-CoA hydratase/isomerase family protein [Betaproteobacteria bacterium]